MKHLVRDIAVALCDASGAASRYRAKQRQSGPLTRAISFHDVQDRDWFAALIKMLSERYHVLSIADFVAERFSEDHINILLTFDDGYESWTSACAPVLSEYGCEGLFFVNSGLLDAGGSQEASEAYMRERLLVSPKKPLTWDGARELRDAGHTIGGHTISHPRLGALAREELKREIADDKARTEAELGESLTHFAYPFGRHGDFTEAAREVATQAGYTHIYTAETGFFAGDMHAIPRTLIEKEQSIPKVRQWIDGGYDVCVHVKRSLIRHG